MLPDEPIPPAARDRPGVADWVLVAALSALSGVIAIYGVFYLPVYNGSTPLPVSAVAAGLALAVLPRVTYRLTRRMPAAFAPAVVWFVITVGLYLTPNALYASLPVAWRGWQFALLVGIGGLASAASIGLVWGDHLRAAIDARRPTDRTLG